MPRLVRRKVILGWNASWVSSLLAAGLDTKDAKEWRRGWGLTVMVGWLSWMSNRSALACWSPGRERGIFQRTVEREILGSRPGARLSTTKVHLA